MTTGTKDRKSSVKDAIKAGVRPKKMSIKSDGSKKKAKAKVDVKKEAPSNKVQDIVAALPEHKQKNYVKANAVGETKQIKVDINDITATSQVLYVADIHALNPQILATAYWIIMPNTSNVVLRVTKDDYEELLTRKEAQSMNHLYSVVDNAVYPSLTYGSWKLKDIKNFPTLEQIDEYDAKFRTMEVSIHNQPIVGLIASNDEVAATSDDNEEDEFEIDFSDDEGDDVIEEDEFDFAED